MIGINRKNVEANALTPLDEWYINVQATIVYNNPLLDSRKWSQDELLALHLVRSRVADMWGSHPKIIRQSKAYLDRYGIEEFPQGELPKDDRIPLVGSKSGRTVSPSDWIERCDRTLMVNSALFLESISGELRSEISHLYAMSSLQVPVADNYKRRKIDKHRNRAFDLLQLFNRDGTSNWIGNQRQISCAKAIGSENLADFYALVSGLGLAKSLKWTCLKVPRRIAEKFLERIIVAGEICEEWKGNRGQIACAKWLGDMNLSQVYSLASSFGFAKKLQWTHMDASCCIAEKFLATVLNDDGQVKDEWKGNRGQIACAKQLGEINLSSLYSLASGLDLIKSLGWRFIHSPYSTVQKFFSTVLDDDGQVKDEWKGNRGQIACARELGGMNLHQLYQFTSGLGFTESLMWTIMNVPCRVAENFLISVLGEDGKVKDEWKGNRGQISFAKYLGGINLSSLGALAYGLNFEMDLEWSWMKVSYKNAAQYEDIIKTLVKSGEIDRYRYRSGRVLFCLEFSLEFHAALNLAEEFGFEEILSWRLKSKTPRGSISLDDTLGNKPFSYARIADTSLSVAEEKVFERQLYELLLSLITSDIPTEVEEINRQLGDILNLDDSSKLTELITKVRGMDKRKLAEIFDKDS